MDKIDPLDKYRDFVLALLPENAGLHLYGACATAADVAAALAHFRPDLRIVGVMDDHRSGEFLGHPVLDPATVRPGQDEHVLVACPEVQARDALLRYEEAGTEHVWYIPSDYRFFLMAAMQMISGDDFRDDQRMRQIVLERKFESIDSHYAFFPFVNVQRTICEVHRELSDLVFEGVTDKALLDRMLPLIHEATVMGKKMDKKLRQYRYDWDDSFWERSKYDMVEKYKVRLGRYLERIGAAAK